MKHILFAIMLLFLFSSCSQNKYEIANHIRKGRIEDFGTFHSNKTVSIENSFPQGAYYEIFGTDKVFNNYNIGNYIHAYYIKQTKCHMFGETVTTGVYLANPDMQLSQLEKRINLRNTYEWIISFNGFICFAILITTLIFIIKRKKIFA